MLAQSSEYSSQRRTGDLCKYGRVSEKRKQLHLVVDDQELVTINWSINDCLVEALQEWKIGDTVAGAIESPQAVPMGAFISEIVRFDDQGRAAMRFITIAPLGEGFPK